MTKVSTIDSVAGHDRPVDEIEITEEMIRRGLDFLERRGISDLTSQTLHPDFVVDFLM